MAEPWVTKAGVRRVQVAAVAAALVELAAFNVPPDVQEVLLVGDPSRRIKPGSLEAALLAGLRVVLEYSQKEVGDAAD